MHTLREESETKDGFKNEYWNGRAEIRFSGIWYPATITQIHARSITYRLNREAKRQVGFKRSLFGLFQKPDFVIYPEGYEGRIHQSSPNIRPAKVTD